MGLGLGCEGRNEVMGGQCGVCRGVGLRVPQGLGLQGP